MFLRSFSCFVIFFIVSVALAADAGSLMPVVIEGQDASYRADVFQDTGGVKRLQVSGNGDTINIIPVSISDKIVEYLKYSGSSDMLVDGSSIAKAFRYESSVTVNRYIDQVRCFGTATSTPKFGQFLGYSIPLTNGLDFTIRSDGDIFTLPVTIKTTEDWKNVFAIGQTAEGFRLDFQPASDQFIAIFPIPQPALLKLNNSDYVEMKVQDDLTGIKLSELKCIVTGWER